MRFYGSTLLARRCMIDFMLTNVLGIICPACDLLNVANVSHCKACGSTTSTGHDDLPRKKPWSSMQHPSPQHPQALATPEQNSVLSYGLNAIAGPSHGQRFTIQASPVQVGKLKDGINFQNDPFVSSHHASLFIRDGQLFIRDEHSTSGVFVNIDSTIPITPGTLFATGIRLFRYIGSIQPTTPWNGTALSVYGAPLPDNQIHYAVQEVLVGGRPGRCIVTPKPVFRIGQRDCDFSYPHDESLAQCHCALEFTPQKITIQNLSGNLGTFIQIQSEWRLNRGDKIRIGQQTLQVEM